MKFKILTLLLFIANFSFAQNNLDKNETTNIKKLIHLFKTKNIGEIAKNINYPLSRDYPIPAVKNEADLKKRFNQIFDASIVKTISSSKMSQWSEVGWRGIMLDSGDIWVETDGKIKTVNYQSRYEVKQKALLIANQKKRLHSSLKNFVAPTYKIKTKSYLIRIDELQNDQYRYASWKTGKLESTAPDIILTDGKIVADGTGGNHSIIFTKGDYQYIIYRSIIGENDSPEVSLTVEEKGKTILEQDGKLL